jgi:predicted Zn finger-like uncharacterized protein
LYTQCPECSTVFRVTADMLRAAQGRVRCGICSTGFNAIENLSEHPVPRAAAEWPADDTITVEELPGNEFIELSGATGTDDDEAVAADLASCADDGAAETTPPAVEDEFDAIPDAALEFHGSPADLERLFVDAAPSRPEATSASADAATGDAELGRAIDEVAAADFSGIEVSESELPWPEAGDDPFGASHPGLIASALALPAAAPSPVAEAAEGIRETPPAVEGDEPRADDLDRTDEYPVLVLDEADAGEASAAPDEAPAGEETAAAPDRTEGGSRDTAQAGGEPDAMPLLLIPEQLRRDAALSAAEELAAPADFEQPAGPRRWPLVAGIALLAIALVAQAAHYWRQDLARNPAFGPWLLRAYGALGLDAPAPVDLSAFELRQLGAASEPNQAGRIKVRASIVNRAPFAQPYPVLRLSLQDRFGATIGSRELLPAEYMPGGEANASALLGPAQRADAEIVFVDPGRDAVGFELDVCVAQAAGLRCSADLPQQRP